MADVNRTPSRDQISRLGEAQSNASQLAQRELGRVWAEVLEELPPERQRDALLELVPALIVKYSDLSSTAAAQWYQQVRDKWFDDDFQAQTPTRANDDLSKLIRSKAGVLWDTDDQPADPMQMLTFLNGVIDKGVKQGGRDAIRYNAKRDPRKPRYARVPQGPTCEFCVMCASRGFVYASEDTAGALGQYHGDCNCEIIPSWDKENPIVEGYDPDALYKTYSRCADTVDDDNLKTRYPVERKLVKDKKTGKERWETKNEFKTRCIVSEMRTRRKEWINDPTDTADYTQDEKAKPEEKEKQAANILTDNGFAVHFRQTRAAEKKRTSDIFLGNGTSSLPWELKQPKGNGKQTIAHQFEEAAGQSSRLVLDARELDPNGRWNHDEILNEVRKLIRWHWKDSKGNTMQYDEVIVLGNNGLTRIKRAKQNDG